MNDCVWSGVWGVDGGWMSLPTRPQLYGDPASLFFFLYFFFYLFFFFIFAVRFPSPFQVLLNHLMIFDMQLELSLSKTGKNRVLKRFLLFC